MKTHRLAIITTSAALTVPAMFAGPGPQYWESRRAGQAAKQVELVQNSASKEQSAMPCEAMIVKQGKRTSTVKCDGAVTDTAKCKAACGIS